MSQLTERQIGRRVHLVLAAAAALGIGVAAGCAPAPREAQAESAPAETVAGVPADVIQAMRAATDKYRDVKAAEADGYIRDPMNHCITAVAEGQPPQLGGMGVHYFRPDLLKITATEPRVGGAGTHTDFMQPGVLIYEPQADGSLELVAVENLVFQAGWQAEGRTDLPAFHGNQYYSMVDNPVTTVDEAHMFEPHYELHAWIYRDNPNGLFAQFNPNVTCEHHRADAPAHATHGE